jgi:ssRNA-specific RNase YbeY (16S rRNA maturation enzyme)
VHGTLHLLGFDDHQPQDTEKMRSAEQNILKQAIAANIF